MIIDSKEIEANTIISTDLCIVGTGVAGIPIAKEFIDSDYNLVMIESGGLEPDAETQSLNWGKNVGLRYYDLDIARIRAFGGTSHRWHAEIGKGKLGVRLRSLDEIDFEKRDWVPYSGWPFKKSHLDPYYERAHTFCKIGPYTNDAQDWHDPATRPQLPFSNGSVRTTIFQFAHREILYDHYRAMIKRAKNINTILNSTVVNIETTETGKEISRLKIACPDGRIYWVKAKYYILAMGGLETPRLLLLSNNMVKTGLGNQNDLVGRFFMEHPHHWSGEYYPSNPDIFQTTNLYRVHNVNGTPIMGKLTLSESTQKKENLLNFTVSIHPTTMLLPKKTLASFVKFGSDVKRFNITKNSFKKLKTVLSNIDHVVVAGLPKIMRKQTSVLNGRFWKYHGYRLNVMSEQTPNPESKLILDKERDKFGLNRIKLRWSITPQDIQSIRKSLDILDQEIRRAGLGRLEIDLKDDNPPKNLHGGWHHMGTTRMHTDPKHGVVDENCRVHGISNLYIAGSSVYPTVGYANPVLTTVALSIRLADYLKKICSHYKN